MKHETSKIPRGGQCNASLFLGKPTYLQKMLQLAKSLWPVAGTLGRVPTRKEGRRKEEMVDQLSIGLAIAAAAIAALGASRCWSRLRRRGETADGTVFFKFSKPVHKKSLSLE